MARSSARDVSVAIPTYGREQTLVETLQFLLAQDPRAAEILVLDQTQRHTPSTEAALGSLSDENQIRWIRLDRPSIPGAMNTALREATRSIVLFLDDDIIPAEGLIEAHAESYEDPATWAVAGQVLQPGQVPTAANRRDSFAGLRHGLDFPFNSVDNAWVTNVMAGNLSVRRSAALAAGGFDENFVGVAFRFETEFARRVVAAGGRILFQPRASIRHLQVPAGGTRSYGSHLTTTSPFHAVGDYYFALRQGVSAATLRYIVRRPFREVCTRFHLSHPWRIPGKLVGEIRGLVLALTLAKRGPRYATRVSER